ncbi:MAG: hypothetical protein WD740_09140 [Anaerolineales bacterium]
MGLELVFHQELWIQIQERFARFKRKPSENNRRQAELPQGAIAIPNAVGTAPGFLVEHGDGVVAAMPGVPSEMRYILEHGILPYIHDRFGKGAVIRTRILHIAGIGESLIDEKIADLERQANPTVGLAAHAGTVDVRLTAKAPSPAQAAVMLAELEAQVRQRLGDWIFGADGETLASAVLAQLATQNLTLAVIEKGLESTLIQSLTGQGSAFVGGELLQTESPGISLSDEAARYAKELPADLVLAVELHSHQTSQQVELVLVGLGHTVSSSLSYGGSSQQAIDWAVNLALSMLRRELMSSHRPLESKGATK